MEQKTNALKVSGRVIAIIMKIGYIAMIVAVCICGASLIFMAITGGETSIATSGGVNFLIADASAAPAELVPMLAQYTVMSGFLLAIFLLAYRMFGEISRTGEPFTAKYVKIVRAIGILVAAMTVGLGITDIIVSAFAASEGLKTYVEAPGIVVGAVIFCLSYIIDYGVALKSENSR